RSAPSDYIGYGGGRQPRHHGLLAPTFAALRCGEPVYHARFVPPLARPNPPVSSAPLPAAPSAPARRSALAGQSPVELVFLVSIRARGDANGSATPAATAPQVFWPWVPIAS